MDPARFWWKPVPFVRARSGQASLGPSMTPSWSSMCPGERSATCEVKTTCWYFWNKMPLKETENSGHSMGTEQHVTTCNDVFELLFRPDSRVHLLY